MKRFFCLLIAAAVRGLAAGTTFLWPCNDGGTPPATVRCDGHPRQDGRITPAKQAAFLKVKDGTVLRLDGSSVVIPHSPELDMTEGFILSVKCNPDFTAAKNRKWMGLISKGKNYSSGYALMFDPAGAILLTLKTDKELLWLQTKGGAVRSGKEQTVTVSAHDGMAKIYVDEKMIASRKYKGKLQDAGHPLYIGAGYYGYFGTVRNVKLSAFDEAALPENRELASAGKKHEWKFGDGTGSAVVRCSSTVLLDGKIRAIGKSRWAQADERGFFLRLDGASVEIPFQRNIDYPEVYSVTPNNEFIRGKLWALAMAPLTIILFFNIVAVIRRRKKLSKKYYIGLLVYMIPMSVTMLIHMFIQIEVFVVAGLALFALTMYGFILSDNIEQYSKQQQEIAHQKANIMVLQMRPHFIYNTLTTIYYLCKQDADKARTKRSR